MAAKPCCGVRSQLLLHSSVEGSGEDCARKAADEVKSGILEAGAMQQKDCRTAVLLLRWEGSTFSMTHLAPAGVVAVVNMFYANSAVLNPEQLLQCSSLSTSQLALNSTKPGYAWPLMQHQW